MIGETQNFYAFLIHGVKRLTMELWSLYLQVMLHYKHVILFQVIGLLDVFHPSTSLDDFQQV
jgi:hypothetical protein